MIKLEKDILGRDNKQHTKSTGVFCKVARCAVLLEVYCGKTGSQRGVKGGLGLRLSLDGQGQILVSSRQHLNFWILFCGRWGVEGVFEQGSYIFRFVVRIASWMRQVEGNRVGSGVSGREVD